MNRRQFSKRVALTGVVGLLGGTAFKCGSEKVSVGIQTVVSFLREISGLLPGQVDRIAQIIKVASDFDTAYQRGDFSNAAVFFNTLVDDIKTFTGDFEISISDQGKTWLAIIAAAVRSVAVLLHDQGVTQPAVTTAKASSRAAGRAAGTITTLANPVTVKAVLDTVKL